LAASRLVGMTRPLAPLRRTITEPATSTTPVRGGSLWQPVSAPARTRPARPRMRRRPARQRPLVVSLLAVAAGIGLGVTVGLEVTAESAGSLSATGGIVTALGRLAGLLAAYAMIVVVLLVARVPPLERAIGQDRLVGWHRKLGPWPLYLLLAHVVLITVGYAQQAHTGDVFRRLAEISPVVTISNGLSRLRFIRFAISAARWSMHRCCGSSPPATQTNEVDRAEDGGRRP